MRYYGLYSSRTKGIWNNIPNAVRLAPEGFSKKQEELDAVIDDSEVQSKDVKGSAKRSAWVRMINKVYGIDPLICSKCGSEMQIVSFIIKPEQIDRIMQHLINKGRAPPGITETSTI